jgi:hypothetical protein
MPFHEGSPLLYSAVRDFVDRCLVHDLVLSGPLSRFGRRNIYGWLQIDLSSGQTMTPDPLSEATEQFAPLPTPCWKLFADALYVYLLPSSFIKEKYDFIASLVRSHIPDLPELSNPVWALSRVDSRGLAITII